MTSLAVLTASRLVKASSHPNQDRSKCLPLICRESLRFCDIASSHRSKIRLSIGLQLRLVEIVSHFYKFEADTHEFKALHKEQSSFIQGVRAERFSVASFMHCINDYP
jgi:hypothetical protein